MKKALIHDWFVTAAGAEKCVESFTNIWDDFDIFSLVDYFNDKDRQNILKGKFAHTSFIQKLPFSKSGYKNYLPLFPIAVEQFNLSKYDLVLSSSHAVAKGVITNPDQLHISYIHTPIRYAWDMYQQYLKDGNLKSGAKGLMAKCFLHKIRLWDISTINRVDHYIANSNFVASRIKKIYGKDSKVIYPPVNTDKFSLQTKKEDFYFTASRLVPYKKVDLIVEAFGKTDKKLVVVGDGDQIQSIKQKAKKNIEFLGYQTDDVLADLMQRAKAFIFAAIEDFGITPIEAQACGTPVICLGIGGTKESVLDMQTGVHFKEQNIQSLLDAIDKFEQNIDKFDYTFIRNNALKFSKQNFEKNIKEFVEEKYKIFKQEGRK